MLYYANRELFIWYLHWIRFFNSFNNSALPNARFSFRTGHHMIRRGKNKVPSKVSCGEYWHMFLAFCAPRSAENHPPGQAEYQHMPSNKTSETKKQKSCSCIEYWLIRFGLEVSSRTKYRESSIYSGFFCNKSELSSCRDLGLTVWFCLGPWFELCLRPTSSTWKELPSLPHWKTCCCGFEKATTQLDQVNPNWCLIHSTSG